MRLSVSIYFSFALALVVYPACFVVATDTGLRLPSSSSVSTPDDDVHHDERKLTDDEDEKKEKFCIPRAPDFDERKPKVNTFALMAFVGLYFFQSTIIMLERKLIGGDKIVADLFAAQMLFDGTWLNWYKFGFLRGFVRYLIIRSILGETAVFDTNTEKQLEGSDDLVCDDNAKIARTADGTCNDLDLPLMGARHSRFGRNAPNKHAFPDWENLMYPNPREVSNKLLARRPGTTPPTADFFNMLGTSWLQFMTHDWFQHEDNENMTLDNVMEIPLPDDDPFRDLYGIECLKVMRTMPDPSRDDEDQDKGRAPTFRNSVSHWWDGSQIYGSDQSTQDRLRSGVDGKMNVTDDGTLMPELDGRSDSGFTDNWWIGLEVLHTLFVLEHNDICEMLKDSHPEFDDQRLFDVARLINTAIMARIHSMEWTPSVIPHKTMELTGYILFEGLEDLLSPFGIGWLSWLSEDLARGNTGVVGKGRFLDGNPYALTEEFVSVYRFHALLPDQLDIKRQTEPDATVPTGATRDGQARTWLSEFGMRDMLHSLGSQEATALVLHNYPDFLRDLDAGPHGLLDIGAIDILRDRERGIPRYNEYRRLLALKPVDSFEEMTGGDEELAAEIRDVYDDDIEMVDLQIGMLSEGVRPTCWAMGETTFQLFLLVSSYRLHKDRFYTDDYRKEIYTQEGLDRVESTTMKSLILRHFPDLADTGLGDISNAFMPWRD